MLYKGVRDEKGIIINLASKEYSKCIERYLSEEDTYRRRYLYIYNILRIICRETGNKRYLCKMARGEMVRFMAENCIENPEEIKKFNRLGYVFREDLSSK